MARLPSFIEYNKLFGIIFAGYCTGMRVVEFIRRVGWDYNHIDAISETFRKLKNF